MRNEGNWSHMSTRVEHTEEGDKDSQNMCGTMKGIEVINYQLILVICLMLPSDYKTTPDKAGTACVTTGISDTDWWQSILPGINLQMLQILVEENELELIYIAEPMK